MHPPWRSPCTVHRCAARLVAPLPLAHCSWLFAPKSFVGLAPIAILDQRLSECHIAPLLTWSLLLQIVLAPRAASVPEVPMLPAHLAGGPPLSMRRSAGIMGTGRTTGARSGLEVTHFAVMKCAHELA